MTNNNLLKRIFAASVSCLLFAFVAFVSFFSFSEKVRAEEVVEYTAYFGSDLWSPVLLFTTPDGSEPASSNALRLGYYQNGQRSVECGFINFRINLRENEDGTTTFAPQIYYAEDTPYTGSQSIPPTSILTLLPMSRKWGNTRLQTTRYSDWYKAQPDKNGVVVYIFMGTMISSNDWTPNVVSVQFYKFKEQIGTSRYYYYNGLRFYDKNGEYAEVLICFNVGQLDTIVSDDGWDERTYYLNNPNNFSDNESYQIGYGDGYGAGLSDSINENYTTGYNDGYALGDEQGYYRGLNDGRRENLTFLSLLTAVIDAPIQAIYRAFDFEVLGMNMKDFFLGLLSVAIIIFVIRFITGKKDG